jgi:hypothetical protein
MDKFDIGLKKFIEFYYEELEDGNEALVNEILESEIEQIPQIITRTIGVKFKNFVNLGTYHKDV